MDPRIEYYRSMLGDEEFDRLRCLPAIPALLEQMGSYAAAPAVAWDGGCKTYRELLDDTASLRGFFAEKGFAKGAHIGILMRNSYDFVKTFLAITSAGYVAVLFVPGTPAPVLAGAMQKYNVACLLYGPEFAETVSGANLPIPSFEIGACSGSPAPANGAIAKETPAAILFSSGTSGRPKGVMLSHGALMRGTLNGSYGKYHTFGQTYVLLLPLTHVFGLVRSLLTPLMTGSQVYINQNMKDLFRDLATAQPDILILVPALAGMLVHFAQGPGPRALGGKLKIIIAGGAPVPQGLIQGGMKLGVEILPGYGLTETANLVSGNGFPLKTPHTVGMPYPEQELKIVDGELWVKGDHLFKEYYGDPAATAEAFSDGWFKTGDLARIDEDGILSITGRKKNIIVAPTGENISPEELEELANALPLVKDSLVYEGKNDFGQAVLVMEILPQAEAAQAMGTADVPAALEAAVAELCASLPSCKRIGKIIVRNEDFPRSPSMKIIRPNERRNA